MEMADTSKCNHHAGGSFAEVTSVVGVELRWTQWMEQWRHTYLLHTVGGEKPVMWVRLNSQHQRISANLRCHTFRGKLETEWEGQRPTLLQSATYWLLSAFGVPDPYRQYEALRSEDGNEIIGLYRVLRSDSFENWRAEIAVRDNAYQMRQQYLPLRLKILLTGYKIIVADGNEDVITAEVPLLRSERSRITVHRAVEGVEAVLAFLFWKVCTMERDDKSG
jgi:hypothetical protein